MKKLILTLGLLLAAITVTAIPTFTSVQDAQTWKDNYENPVFGTATIKSIETTLNDDFYHINYLLEYTNKMETMLDKDNKTVDKVEKEYVDMQIRKPLPSDKEIEDLVNTHALDYFDTVLNIEPDPKVSLTQHSLIGKKIVLERPPPPPEPKEIEGELFG